MAAATGCRKTQNGLPSARAITQRQIETYSADVAREFRPLKIVLFGSYAYGNPTDDSDVDLMVVMPRDGSGAKNRDKSHRN